MIVYDHPAIREMLAIRIGREADLEVCGEAADLPEALRIAAAANPNLAVIDLALKSASGIDLIKRLKARDENLLMIVWSMYSEDLYAERVSPRRGEGLHQQTASDRQHHRGHPPGS